jgi:hypothetical protein
MEKDMNPQQHKAWDELVFAVHDLLFSPPEPTLRMTVLDKIDEFRSTFALVKQEADDVLAQAWTDIRKVLP